jgi:hypothetical protein
MFFAILGHAQLMVEADNECDLPCGKKLWDGYGRWNINNQWKPFVEEINLPSSSGNKNNYISGAGCIKGV